MVASVLVPEPERWSSSCRNTPVGENGVSCAAHGADAGYFLERMTAFKFLNFLNASSVVTHT
jgi:hypothetical protein